MLYYPNQDNASDLEVQQRLILLKDSLSRTLTRFYPLAGKIKDDLSIDCNDVGTYFAVACVNTRLDEFLNHPDYEHINHFLPCELTFNGSSVGTCVSNVQVSIFECGGIAISLCISHKIFDGGSLSTFVKSWAGTSYGSQKIVYPNLGAASLFPANDLWLKDSSLAICGALLKTGKCRTTRFVFNSSKLVALKADAVAKGVKDPTRVEVVSALLWKCFMVATEEKTDSRKPSLLSHVVNLRKRLVSTLSENAIGNLIWLASAECKTNSQIQLCDLVQEVRNGVSKINSEFVKKIQGDKGTKVMEESLKSLKECEDSNKYIGFTSLCKMGFYEADFGWGKPIWACGGGVCEGSSAFMNMVVLMDTKYGDGIEAWVNMDEHEMHALKHNPELLTFASIDPSPLQINY
ncbi:vinorine synthase-like protein [Tanacetum coccineum]